MADNLPMIGGIGSLISGLMGQNQQDWLKNALVNVLNNQNTANSFGLNYGLNQFNPATNSAQTLLGLAPQFLFGQGESAGDMNALRDKLQSAIGTINPSQFQQSAMSPEMQAIMSIMGSTAGQNAGTSDLLRNVVANGGGSQASQNIADQLQTLMSGHGNNVENFLGTRLMDNPGSAFTQTAQGAGQNALQNGGMTPSLQNALSALQYMVSQGGSNGNMDAGVQQALKMMGGNSPFIQQLAQAGGNGLQSNLGVTGLTPTGALGEQTALQGILNNGSTPTTNFFTQRGAQLAGQDAVMPTALALSFARDDATRQMKNAAEAARTQALAHGGGPGAVVANGTSNDALADFADRGAQGVSQAVEQALLNQQGLGLQQQANGAQMGLGGGQLQTSNLGVNSNLLNNLEGNATQRYGVGGGLLGNAQQASNAQSNTGLNALQGLSGLQSQNILGALGLIPGTNNAAANNANVFGNLGLGAGQLDLANLTEGGNLNNQYNNNMFNGLQGLQGNLNQANNYTLGSAGALNNLSGTQGNILNSILGAQLGAGQLGMNQGSNYYNSLSGLLGQQGNLVGQELGMYGTAYNPLMQAGNQGFNYANTALGGMSNVFHGYQPNNQAGNGLAGLLGGIGGLLGGLM